MSVTGGIAPYTYSLSYEALILTSSNLLGYWPMNDAAGAISDRSGSGLAGTPSGAALSYSAAAPPPQESTASIQFATGSQVTMANTENLIAGRTAVTIECWVFLTYVSLAF